MESSIFGKVQAALMGTQPQVEVPKLIERLDQSLAARVDELDHALDEVSARVESARATVPKQQAADAQAQINVALEKASSSLSAAAALEAGAGAELSSPEEWAACLQQRRLDDIQQCFELVSSLMAQLMADLPRELERCRASVTAAEAAVNGPQSKTDAVIAGTQTASPVSKRRKTGASPRTCAAAMPSDVMRQRLLHEMR
eukprot:g2890.t1